MQKTFVLFLILALPLLAFGLLILDEEGVLPFSLFARNTQAVVRIADIPIQVAIADTPAERVQGLSGRAQLAENTGLLLVFPNADHHGIWMKDMNFPIDVLWLNGGGRIVDIAHDVGPETFPTVFRPDAPAQYILEVNANFAEIFGIKIGDVVNLGDAVKN